MKGHLKSQRKRKTHSTKGSNPSTKRSKPRKSRRQKLREKENLKANILSILMTMLDDLHQSIPCYRGVDHQRDKITLEKRFSSEGIGFATKSLPDLFQGLLHRLENDQWPTLNFKFKDDVPVFLGTIVRQVIKQGPYRYQCIDKLYTFCHAFKKLRGTYKKNQLLKQFLEFSIVDAELPNEIQPDPLVNTARSIIAGLTCDISDDSDLIPRPGPGATNEQLKKYMRYEPHILWKNVDKVLPFADWFYPTKWDVVNESRKYMGMPICDEPASRFKFVPKTYGKARGICIEYNEIQFLQQAFARGLRTVINRIPTLDINDQSINANKALEASMSREFATLDLKEASDRVSRSLVSFLFQDNDFLHDALMALSTRKIIPPKEAIDLPIVETKKFAPMGSALCFPVMTLCLYSLCKATILHSGCKTSVRDSKRVYVYGDDILVPTRYYESVINTIEKYGMKVNKNKSFAYSHFRESCGTHAYHGRLITPVYIKYVPSQQRFDSFLSCLAVESQLFYKGFTETARLFRKIIAKTATALKIKKIFSEVPYDSPLVGFRRKNLSSTTSFLVELKSFKRKWVKDLQTYLYRVPTIAKRMKEKHMLSDIQSLMRWHGERPEWTKSRRSNTVEETPSELQIRWRWVP